MNFEDNFILQSRHASFCNCKNDCSCGENNVHDWAWDKEQASHTVVLSKQNLEVKFHNGFSNGTAIVRGNKLLEKGKHHYWEVKILTISYGTDIMVGVGTNKVDLNAKNNIFCSLLGLDQESFGISYHGYIQHGGKKREYGSHFGQGSLVGVYLNTWRGTLEFFLNRKPLGIAFTGLQNIMLYPMVSSTAAESEMRLTHSCSIPASLQVECLAVLKSSQREYLVTMFPGLRHLSESIFADILKTELNDSEDERDDFKFLTDCIILDDFDFALVGISRKKKKKQNSTVM